MLIVCPSCATSYDVEPVSLLPEGRYVCCLRCRMVWHAVPSHADKLLAAAVPLGPEPSLAEGMPEAEAQMSQPEPPAQAAADMAWSNECAGDLLDDEPPGEGGSFAAAHDEWTPEGESIVAAAEEVQPADEGSVFVAADDDLAEEGETFIGAVEDEHAAEDGLVLAVADEYDPAAADEIAADEPSESAEEEAPPIAPVDLDQVRLPVDLDQARLPIEIDEDAPAYSAEPLQAIRSFTAWPHLGRARHRSPPRWPMSRLHTGILALLIVDCILVGWRSNVVRAFPQTDSFYKLVGLPVNLRGLAFEAITTMTERHEGVPILVVEGNIVNSARKFVDVPRLKFVVRNAARQEIYSWATVASRTPLPPGEAVSFRTRLASPPPETHDVVLRFVDRRDIVAAAR
jgi:predicted Zn finger-like uncharacterized protein